MAPRRINLRALLRSEQLHDPELAERTPADGYEAASGAAAELDELEQRVAAAERALVAADQRIAWLEQSLAARAAHDDAPARLTSAREETVAVRQATIRAGAGDEAEPGGRGRPATQAKLEFRLGELELRRRLADDEHLVHFVRAIDGGKHSLLAVTDLRLLLSRSGEQWEQVDYGTVHFAQIHRRRFGGLELHIACPGGDVVVKGAKDDLESLLTYLRARMWDARPHHPESPA